MPARWRTPRHGRGPRPRWHRRRRRVRRTRPPRRAARGSRCRRVGKTCATPGDRSPAARRDRTARTAARLAAAPRRGESLRSRRRPRRWPHPTRSRGREPVRRRLARGRHTTLAPRSNGACGLGGEGRRLTYAPTVALDRYGSGCTGSRLLNGTLDLHEQLEGELAQFFGKEACLVFSTGYQANLGIVSGLVGRGDVVFLDKLDHASIVDGAKMSYGQTERFNHGDVGSLERKLQQVPPGTGVMIIVDGVYSMEGDIADVPNLLKIAQKHGAALALDDAHAVGGLAPRGAGTAAHVGLSDDVDLIVGTFSKSLASIGGFVAGPEGVIEFLRYNARPLMFTAALPPSNTAGVPAALHVMQREPHRRQSPRLKTRLLQPGLRARGVHMRTTET